MGASRLFYVRHIPFSPGIIHPAAEKNTCVLIYQGKLIKAHSILNNFTDLYFELIGKNIPETLSY